MGVSCTLGYILILIYFEIALKKSKLILFSKFLGSGVYVIIGNIISNYTGPSIIVSLIIAGFCSFLAGNWILIIIKFF